MSDWGPAFASVEDSEADWRLARQLGLRLSVHLNGSRPVGTLRERGLLGPDITYIHCNGVTDEDLRAIAGSGGTASVSPLLEAQMRLGRPEVGRLRRFGVTTSLGADSVTAVGGDMFGLMRAALAFGRTDDESITPADVLRMATLDGAASLGLDDRIGSLRPGKRADVVLLRTDAPGLAPLHGPIGAVVTAAGVRDVDTVLVAGEVVKRDGRLTGAGAARGLELADRSARHLVAG